MLLYTISKKQKQPLFLLLPVLSYIKSLLHQFVKPNEPTNTIYYQNIHEENAKQVRLDKNKAASYSQEYMTPKREQSK